ncbi:MAG: ubiquitin-like small modifier protein 1 [Egibacteraceae bacterium]
MSVTIRIPTPLRTVTGGNTTVSVDGATAGEVIKALDAAYPGIGERVLDDTGQVRRFVNIFIDDEDIRFARGLDTPVRDGATVSIIPAVAGGTQTGLSVKSVEGR